MKARMESAQHILHHILTNDYGAIQTGMQIHDNKIRIDIRCEKDLTSIPKNDYESKVNNIIKENLPVTKTVYKRNKARASLLW
jgi:Ser-tRNA(Ala) deacylase AlaX